MGRTFGMYWADDPLSYRRKNNVCPCFEASSLRYFWMNDAQLAKHTQKTTIARDFSTPVFMPSGRHTINRFHNEIAAQNALISSFTDHKWLDCVGNICVIEHGTKTSKVSIKKLFNEIIHLRSSCRRILKGESQLPFLLLGKCLKRLIFSSIIAADDPYRFPFDFPFRTISHIDFQLGNDRYGLTSLIK